MKRISFYNGLAVLIKGGAYGASKSRGDMAALKKWKAQIITATKALPSVNGPCTVTLAFSLLADRFPLDHPYGTDVDNLASLVLDALNETVFAKVAGKDSCVVSLNIHKTKATVPTEAGLFLLISPVTGFTNFSFGSHRFPKCLRGVK